MLFDGAGGTDPLTEHSALYLSRAGGLRGRGARQKEAMALGPVPAVFSPPVRMPSLSTSGRPCQQLLLVPSGTNHSLRLSKLPYHHKACGVPCVAAGGGGGGVGSQRSTLAGRGVLAGVRHSVAQSLEKLTMPPPSKKFKIKTLFT